jgi:nitroreductase
MHVAELLSTRRMVRSFTGAPVDLVQLRQLCETALWSPTAGNSAGVRLRIVEHDRVGDYFAVATDEQWRSNSRRFPGLSRAGAVVFVTSLPDAYLSRYSEPDKASSGLADRDHWPIPYWHGDAAMATMSLLLLLEEVGLSATIWGSFRYVDAVRRWANIEEEELYASILIGVGDGADHVSASLARKVPSRAERVQIVRPNVGE